MEQTKKETWKLTSNSGIYIHIYMNILEGDI